MKIYNPMSIKKEDIAKEAELYSVFLAGPCPRSDEGDWRTEFYSQIGLRCKNINFFDPSNPEYGSMGPDAYNIQCNWEREAMKRCNVLMFWVARDDRHPAFTTNVEFGYWLDHSPNKILYGRPDDAPQTRYLDWLYNVSYSEIYNEKPKIFNSLEGMIRELDVWNNCLESN